MPRILLVDDDHEITTLLADYLQRYHFSTVRAHDAVSMREVLAREAVDLVVLDWMLPGTDGLTLARELRQRACHLPIIMLTARAGAFDCVLSLENGADDYMSKPFEPRELVARMQAVLRRVQARAPAPEVMAAEVIEFDGWRLHRMERHLSAPSGVVLPLSNAEFRLLGTFLNHPRQLLSREQLMDEARGRHMEAFDRSIDLLVSRLRHKLDQGGGPTGFIKTVRGLGYLFQVRTIRKLQGQELR
ncbi:MAG: hypothetical protein RLZZ22_677 [Pseudomonadota bacterium]